MDAALMVDFLSATVRIATPILMAAMGGILIERVLAAVIVGRWLPLGTLAGCIMFGATEALQLRVQAFNLPVSSYVIQMVPYLAALLVLAGLRRTASLPAAIGQPFRRD
jgi:ABC-type uncharacterized transport system permease subunit